MTNKELSFTPEEVIQSLENEGIELHIIEKPEEQLKDFDLPWYTKDDLICLLEDYPNLFEMSKDELKQIIRDKYSDAQYHSERANLLECEALAIEKYCEAKYGKEIKQC